MTAMERTMPWHEIQAAIDNANDYDSPCTKHIVATIPETVKMRASHIADDVAICWGCLQYWCDRCDPSPSAQCPYCHGNGAPNSTDLATSIY